MALVHFLFNPGELDDWKAFADNHIADLIAIFVILILAFIVIRIVIRRFFRRLFLRARRARLTTEDPEAAAARADTIVRVVQWFATGFVIFLGFVLLLDEFDKNVNALIAGAGVAGIAIGFAAQHALRDFINGMVIIMEDQYVVGDVVQINGVAGVVEDINPRRTILRDLDGAVHTVPNGSIDVTTNFTEGYSRINLDVSIAYEEDVDRVITIVNDECEDFAADNPAEVLTAPSVLRVNSLGDSGVDLKVLGDVRAGQQWALMGELRRRIKRRFDAEGIEIPYPHRTVTTKAFEAHVIAPNGADSDADPAAFTASRPASTGAGRPGDPAERLPDQDDAD